MSRQPHVDEAALRVARAALTVGEFRLWEGRYLFTPANGHATGRAHSAIAINRLIKEGYAKREGRRVVLHAR